MNAPLKPSFRTPLRTLLCTLLLASALPAWADVGRDEAAAVAQRVASGRVLAVDRAEAGGKPVWRVKILSATGEVRVVVIDARRRGSAPSAGLACDPRAGEHVCEPRCCPTT